MFKPFRPKPSPLQIEMNALMIELGDQRNDSTKYAKTVEQLKELNKIRQDDKPDRPSADTMLVVAANLIGIAVIVRHEHLNALTSKALSFVKKT